MAETKPKAADSLRIPKPKKKLGLSVPPALRLPHDDLIHPESDTTTLTSHTSQTTSTSQASRTSHTSQTPIITEIKNSSPVAPVRDYTKVANSIHREAIPAGVFTGKSKQLYDCLYSLTRGAIVPSRTVRISRPKLMKKASIGARVTFDANVDRLAAVGLIQVRRITGEHDGNEYTVFLPEEISMTSQGSLTSHSSPTSYAENLVRLDGLEGSQTRHTLSVENTNISDEPKTSFKTNTEKNNDDEALAQFNSALRQAAKEITGKKPTPSEAERWGELAEVLVTELKIAAGRTTVSSVPAFLAEHLRRRLWKLENRKQPPPAAEGGEATEPAVSREEARECPDCWGTGMYYPGGFEKGVARCSHERLRPGAEGTDETGAGE
jgi:hypothetical protein